MYNSNCFCFAPNLIHVSLSFTTPRAAREITIPNSISIVSHYLLIKPLWVWLNIPLPLNTETDLSQRNLKHIGIEKMAEDNRPAATEAENNQLAVAEAEEATFEGKGKIRVTFRNGENVPEGYVFVSTGDAMLSRNVRKRTLETGRDVVELKHCIDSRRGYCRTAGNYVPSDILEEVNETVKERQAKRAKVEARRETKQRAEADEWFERLYPRMPADVRDAIYERAFEKGSGRVGTAKDLSMEVKVQEATRYHALHQLTEFPKQFKFRSDDLYRRLQQDLDLRFLDRDDCYARFREEKDKVYDDLSDRYLKEADAIIKSRWIPVKNDVPVSRDD